MMPTPRVYDGQPCPRKYCYANDRPHGHWHNADHSGNTVAPVHHIHCYPPREPDTISPDDRATNALREAADAWRHEGRDVMFNKGGGDLRPEQRVEKWLRTRVDEIENKK